MSNETKTAGETATNETRTVCAVVGDETGYGIIHEEFAKYEKDAWCFRRHEITPEQWRTMTGENELRFWKARGVSRAYTEFGFLVVGHSRRRWGDGLKVLDRWHVVKAGTEYTPVSVDIDKLISAKEGRAE